MSERLHDMRLAAGGMHAMQQLEAHLHDCGLEIPLQHLVRLRASQINGCAYCIDMHWKDLRAIGETEERLYGLLTWRELSLYTERERAALEWTEAVTLVSQTHVDDAVYDAVHSHFSDQELVDLTWLVASINVWNRMSISFRRTPGHYQPVAARAATE